MKIPRTRAAAVVAATATTLALGTATAATGAAGKPTGSERLEEKVKVSTIMTHLRAFQRIADEHGGRTSGTAGYEASAQYVEHRLHAAGYDTERQYFPFTYTEILAEKAHVNAPTARDLENHVMTASPSTPDGGVTADLVSPPTITGCPGQWDGVAATGKIALVQRGGGCTFLEKSQAAGAAGAAAVIMYNNADGELHGTLGNDPTGAIPSTGITQADGEVLRSELAAGTVNMTLDLRTLVEQRQTFNVIAELEGTSPDDVVMLGSHLDSVVGGPGINDNGSGSATTLTVAEQMAKLPAPKNTIRFAWWGAEEQGLVGSTYYVNQLKQKSPDELKRIATYLFDMIGSPNYIVAVYDADQSTYKAPAGVTIPPGSEATEDVFTDYFDTIGQDWVDYAYSGRSDYQAFINNGIAAGGLSSGSDGVKTPEQQALFGGTAGDIYDPNYHTAADDIANVNTTVLGIMSKAVAHAAYTLGQDVSAIRS